MPDGTGPNDLGAVWRSQPPETPAVCLEQLANRRTRELYSSTRSEILASIGAALFLLIVMELRFAYAHNRLLQLGMAAIAVWIVISLLWFRGRIWSAPAPRDALAASGLEHYRKELERRRDHLRNAWVWHGPLFLACAIFGAIAAGSTWPGRLWNAVPLAMLLAAWTAFGIVRRRRHARELQREIDEIGRS